MNRYTSLLVVAFALAGCIDETARLYSTEPFAPGFTEAQVEGLQVLGPTLMDQGVNFGVFSKNAERMDLLLFDHPEDDQPAQQLQMERFGDVWNLYVEGVGLGQNYGYVAWGPNWPYDERFFPGSIHGFIADVDAQGNRFNPNKLLIDPYAKALSRDHDWGRASAASGPGRTQSTWGAGTKSVVVESTYEWSENETDWIANRQSGSHEGHGVADAIIYEIHLKGFTADAASGVDHPGTYRGFGEKAAFLADLGVTAVELLPIHEKPLDGGYWGYNNTSFFAPELSYAHDRMPHEVIDEVKWMIDELHKHDIEVLVDVVYNHTGEGGLWRERIYLVDENDDDFYNFDPHETASIYSWRGLDNAEYYALAPDGLTYWYNTGVGNQTRPNHTPMHQLTMDSLRWMVEELHVDGFRFDLAPVLGEVDGDYNFWDDPRNTILQDIVDDPVLQANNTRIIAEPWSAGGFYNPILGEFPASQTKANYGWGEWNARFRDWWRAFVNYDDWMLNTYEAEADGGFVMTGSNGLYNDGVRGPWASNNFVTVHDGFTMYDLVTYPNKRNGCGPLNPICCSEPNSPWCDTESGEEHNRSRDWGSDDTGEAMKRQMMRNFFAAMLISHGTPLLLGGDEYMRTQHGNNNAYSTWADNSFNWHQWGNWEQKPEAVRMHDFVRDLIHFRKEHAYAFHRESYDSGAPFSWKAIDGSDNVNWGAKSVGIHYYDDSFGPELLILINMERYGVDWTLPQGRNWTKVFDTQRWYDFDNAGDTADYFDQTGADRWLSHNSLYEEPEAVPGGTYGVADSSIVILRAQ